MGQPGEHWAWRFLFQNEVADSEFLFSFVFLYTAAESDRDECLCRTSGAAVRSQRNVHESTEVTRMTLQLALTHHFPKATLRTAAFLLGRVSAYRILAEVSRSTRRAGGSDAQVSTAESQARHSARLVQAGTTLCRASTMSAPAMHTGPWNRSFLERRSDLLLD
jgi:hypothetical protein